MKNNHNLSPWYSKVRGILKAELAPRDINYITLSEKLNDIGIHESPENLSNKISRGKFSAAFLILCLETIGCKTIDIRNTDD